MTKAVTLAELADQNVLSVDGANNRVGIASTQPTTTLDVGGTVTAVSFVGSGEGLTGVASTDNIVTGTAATFTAAVNISGLTTVGVMTVTNALNVTGVITATSFEGSGALLTGLPAGFTELDAALFN